MKTAYFVALALSVAASATPRYLRALCAPALADSALGSSVSAPQTISPEWCKNLPRPEYKTLERVLPNEPWFEIYRIRPGVFAIYEPKQAEEVISYLIVGTKQALLFDTGMGIANIQRVVRQLTG